MAKSSPTDIPSGMLCSVTAETSSVVRFQPVGRPSGWSASACRCGRSVSSAMRKATPRRKPPAAGSQPGTPCPSACSMAGLSSDHTLAATMTPAANPRKMWCMRAALAAEEEHHRRAGRGHEPGEAAAERGPRQRLRDVVDHGRASQPELLATISGPNVECAAIEKNGPPQHRFSRLLHTQRKCPRHTLGEQPNARSNATVKLEVRGYPTARATSATLTEATSSSASARSIRARVT